MNKKQIALVAILTIFIITIVGSSIFGVPNKKQNSTFEVAIIDSQTNMKFTQTVKKGGTVKDLKVPDKEGYEFLYWEDENGKRLDENQKLKAGQIIRAVYKEKEKQRELEPAPEPEKKQYKVNFVVDGKSQTMYVEEGKTVTEPTTPQKEGYAFTGWELDGNLYDFNTPVTKDIEIIGKWQEIKKDTVEYTVTFDSAGGSAVQSKKVIENGIINKPTNPTKKGYTFVEWRLNGKVFNFNTRITKDITLTAVWKKKETQSTPTTPTTPTKPTTPTTPTTPTQTKYSVVLNANGGKINGNSTTTITVTSQSTGNLPTPSRTGYRFAGWYDSKTGGNQYTKYSEIKKSMTLYAYWAINTYKVVFDANGGKVEGKTSVEKNITINDNSLPTATRSGWVFSGWYTAKNGGTAITKPSDITKNQTLYAQWKTNEYVVAEVPVSYTETDSYYVSDPSIIRVTDEAVSQGNGEIVKYIAKGLKPGTATLTITVENSRSGYVTFDETYTISVDSDLYVRVIS